MIISPKAGGVGIGNTANNVIHLEDGGIQLLKINVQTELTE